MNTEALAALCERVRDHPAEIRVCCPHGHFIVAVWIGVNVSGGDPALLMWPAVGRDHHFRKRAGAIIIDPTPAQLDQLDAGNPNFIPTETRNGLAVAVSCPRCDWKTPPRDYLRLAAELAVHALAGHAEHRLSS